MSNNTNCDEYPLALHLGTRGRYETIKIDRIDQTGFMPEIKLFVVYLSYLFNFIFNINIQ